MSEGSKRRITIDRKKNLSRPTEARLKRKNASGNAEPPTRRDARAPYPRAFAEHVRLRRTPRPPRALAVGLRGASRGAPRPPTFSPSDETASVSTPPLTAPDVDAPDARRSVRRPPLTQPRVPARATARPQDELEPLPAPATFRRPASASPKGPSGSRINGGALRPLAMHQNSSQVANMLNPVTGLRDAQRRAGVTPVNHARDNLLAIKELSLKNKARKEAEAATRIAPFRARPAPSQTKTRGRPASARGLLSSVAVRRQSAVRHGLRAREQSRDAGQGYGERAREARGDGAREAADAAASPLTRRGYGRVPEYVRRRRARRRRRNVWRRRRRRRWRTSRRACA